MRRGTRRTIRRVKRRRHSKSLKPVRRKSRASRASRSSRKIQGGFYTGASYLFDQGASIFQVPAPTPYGNPSLPVNPFPYSQS